MLANLKLRHVLFLLILVAGLIPLIVAATFFFQPSRDILFTQERTDLTRSAEEASREIDEYLATCRRELEMLGMAVLAPDSGEGSGVDVRLREGWVLTLLERFASDHLDSSWMALIVSDPTGQGPQFGPQDLPPEALAAVGEAFQAALESARVEYRFVELPPEGQPAVALAVPVIWKRGVPELVLAALTQPPRLVENLRAGEQGPLDEQVFLVDGEGRLIWSANAPPEMAEALLASPLMEGFRQRPLASTEQYSAHVGGERRDLIAMVSPIAETDWGVVVQKPAAAAFVTARRMLWISLVSAALLVLMALGLAYLASNWLGQPIQRLARTTHAIASGDFSSRVDTDGLGFELADLAADFNAMGGYLQNYIGQLQRAAQMNRELFIGSIRAFTAAIDAKDPYTRGHSERVANLSRILARHLGRSEDFQNRLWVAALVHDVGKIGVEDRILKKGGVLTQEEYEQMKLHTVIGAEIMASIDALREAIPVIRGHHENWNGRGYPDNLKGEQIPLMARIVAVADTFDAITTNRPYQKAYTLEYAVETITKLTGARFDAKIVTAFLKAVKQGEVSIPAPEKTVAPPPRAATG